MTQTCALKSRRDLRVSSSEPWLGGRDNYLTALLAMSGPQRVVDLAEIYTEVGHHDEAINALRDVLAIPSKVTPAILELDPTWDPLRRNPRFAALVASEP